MAVGGVEISFALKQNNNFDAFDIDKINEYILSESILFMIGKELNGVMATSLYSNLLKLPSVNKWDGGVLESIQKHLTPLLRNLV